MKKNLLLKTITLAACLALSMGIQAADGYDFEFQNLKFVITSSTTAKVIGAAVESPYGYWAIPEVANGYEITEIGDNAFKDCINMYGMNIGEKVRKIGNAAFQGCGLRSINIPASVTTIGNNAFYDCVDAYVIVLRESLTTIGAYAFSYCSQLTEVTIPTTVTSIGNYAFLGCEGIKKVTTDDIEAWCNISFGTAQSNPIYYAHNLYLNNSPVTVLPIPEGVQQLKNYAFYNCEWLTSVFIPNSATSIGKSSFTNCTDLKNLSIGSGVTSIGQSAFSNCTNLIKVTCWAATPPTMGASNVFDATTYNSAPLYVLAESFNAYRAANWWKNFINMLSIIKLNEALNVAGGNIQFTSTGNYPWIGEQQGNRIYAVSSNAGMVSTTSTLNATVIVPTGGATLSFDFKAWGEGISEVYDKCIFTVDEAQIFAYGARQNDWETFTMELPAGIHMLAWCYDKDFSIDPEGDYFAVDNVALSTGTLIRGDVTGNGHLDVADVVALIQIVLNSTPANYAVADVNNNGTIDVADVTALIQLVLNQ